MHELTKLCVIHTSFSRVVSKQFCYLPRKFGKGNKKAYNKILHTIAQCVYNSLFFSDGKKRAAE